MPVVNVAYCHVEISATYQSLTRKFPMECGECRREASVVRRPWCVRGCCNIERNLFSLLEFHIHILCFVRHTYIHTCLTKHYIYIYNGKEYIPDFAPPEQYDYLNERLPENICLYKYS